MTSFTLDDVTPRRNRIAWVGVVVLVGVLVFLSRAETHPPSPVLTAEQAELVAMARARPDLLAREMLTRLYQAFEAEHEEAIYDALARAAAGPVLEELYLQRRSALLQRNGAVQAVHDVTLNRLTARWISDQIVVMEADWQVLGTVGHAEHQHQRGNSYAAGLTFSIVENGFRLTGFDLRDIRRDANAGELVAGPVE